MSKNIPFSNQDSYNETNSRVTELMANDESKQKPILLDQSNSNNKRATQLPVSNSGSHNLACTHCLKSNRSFDQKEILEQNAVAMSSSKLYNNDNFSVTDIDISVIQPNCVKLRQQNLNMSEEKSSIRLPDKIENVNTFFSNLQDPIHILRTDNNTFIVNNVLLSNYVANQKCNPPKDFVHQMDHFPVKTQQNSENDFFQLNIYSQGKKLQSDGLATIEESQNEGSITKSDEYFSVDSIDVSYILKQHQEPTNGAEPNKEVSNPLQYPDILERIKMFNQSDQLETRSIKSISNLTNDHEMESLDESYLQSNCEESLRGKYTEDNDQSVSETSIPQEKKEFELTNTNLKTNIELEDSLCLKKNMNENINHSNFSAKKIIKNINEKVNNGLASFGAGGSVAKRFSESFMTMDSFETVEKNMYDRVSDSNSSVFSGIQDNMNEKLNEFASINSGKIRKNIDERSECASTGSDSFKQNINQKVNDSFSFDSSRPKNYSNGVIGSEHLATGKIVGEITCDSLSAELEKTIRENNDDNQNNYFSHDSSKLARQNINKKENEIMSNGSYKQKNVIDKFNNLLPTDSSRVLAQNMNELLNTSITFDSTGVMQDINNKMVDSKATARDINNGQLGEATCIDSSGAMRSNNKKSDLLFMDLTNTLKSNLNERLGKSKSIDSAGLIKRINVKMDDSMSIDSVKRNGKHLNDKFIEAINNTTEIRDSNEYLNNISFEPKGKEFVEAINSLQKINSNSSLIQKDTLAKLTENLVLKNNYKGLCKSCSKQLFDSPPDISDSQDGNEEKETFSNSNLNEALALIKSLFQKEIEQMQKNNCLIIDEVLGKMNNEHCLLSKKIQTNEIRPINKELCIPKMKSKDENDIFGEYVICQLKKHDNCMQALLKYKISHLLFEAELGKYRTQNISKTPEYLSTNASSNISNPHHKSFISREWDEI